MRASTLLGPSDRPWRHLILALLTLGTTTFTFHWLFGPSGGGDPGAALTFAVSLLAILGCHELGHWALARWHGVDASLPYFIPAPFLGFGTLGALIRIRGPIPHRNALVDIGAAGPLAGVLVAIPVLIHGLSQSTLVPVVPAPPWELAGPGSLWGLLERVPGALRAGSLEALLSAHAGEQVRLIFGDNLLMWLMKRWVLGPLPPGMEVAAHPMVLAAWLGLLVTMLNLLPMGQLDGGHLAFAALGEGARRVGQVSAAVLAGLTLLASGGWLLWLLVTVLLVGFGHPPVSRPELPLSAGRRWVCLVCALLLVLCLMPVPLRGVSP
jgi:membrane-associated protease RseP (regulator of RpoE activity)